MLKSYRKLDEQHYPRMLANTLSVIYQLTEKTIDPAIKEFN
jgi:hypothetical protein